MLIVGLYYFLKFNLDYIIKKSFQRVIIIFKNKQNYPKMVYIIVFYDLQITICFRISTFRCLYIKNLQKFSVLINFDELALSNFPEI